MKFAITPRVLGLAFLMQCTIGCAGPALAQQAPVYFRIAMPDPNDAFVIQLTDPEKIAEARRIIAGQEKTNIHVLGNLVPGAVKYNQPWRFSLDPTTIRFVPASPGMCARDAVTSAIEDEIETNSPPPPFCWGPEVSTVTKEVPAP